MYDQNPSAKPWLTFAAISGASAVAMGAFGSHALGQVATNQELQVWRTAVDYHLLHSVALLALALPAQVGRLDWPRRLFALGIVLFSGSLYVLVLTGQRRFGIITPIGGIAFIAGWLALALAVWQHREANAAR